MTKFARNSRSKTPYQCVKLWPDDCFVQCGGAGVIGDYYFFEAFPRSPDTFIRADSAVSIEDAEAKAWARHEKNLSCELDHTDPANFDPRDYKNGAGFCKKCGYFGGSIFPPTDHCTSCGVLTRFSYDLKCRPWCTDCVSKIPVEDQTQAEKMLLMVRKSQETPSSDEEIAAALPAVFDHILKKK